MCRYHVGVLNLRCRGVSTAIYGADDLELKLFNIEYVGCGVAPDLCRLRSSSRRLVT